MISGGSVHSQFMDQGCFKFVFTEIEFDAQDAIQVDISTETKFGPKVETNLKPVPRNLKSVSGP